MTEIDRAVLQDIRSIGKVKGVEVLAKIAGMFLSEAPQLMQKIQQAIVKADPRSLRQNAHCLRSGALGVGAIHVAEICWKLEHASEPLDDAKVKQLFVELSVHWRAAADELGSEAFD